MSLLSCSGVYKSWESLPFVVREKPAFWGSTGGLSERIKLHPDYPQNSAGTTERCEQWMNSLFIKRIYRLTNDFALVGKILQKHLPNAQRKSQTADVIEGVLKLQF